MQKLKVQKELTHTKKSNQNTFIKIGNSVDRQSQLAWQTINEVDGRKSNSRAKLKASSHEERQQECKEHFKNLL